jgi:hypothetical protein
MIRRRLFLSSFWKAEASVWFLDLADHAAASEVESMSNGGQRSLQALDRLYDPSLASTKLSGESADRLCIQRLIDGLACRCSLRDTLFDKQQAEYAYVR